MSGPVLPPLASLIDARNEKVAQWYVGYGAVPLLDAFLSLLLPLAIIEAALKRQPEDIEVRGQKSRDQEGRGCGSKVLDWALEIFGAGPAVFGFIFGLSPSRRSLGSRKVEDRNSLLPSGWPGSARRHTPPISAGVEKDAYPAPTPDGRRRTHHSHRFEWESTNCVLNHSRRCGLRSGPREVPSAEIPRDCECGATPNRLLTDTEENCPCQQIQIGHTSVSLIV